ncbi:MAG: ATP-dependent sacrificial sulfur transferase LarE [Phycisphaerae bacterium]
MIVNLKDKYNSLQAILKKLGKVVVAYSGGVDSTFLLKAAVETLGAENVLACIAVGPSLPQNQYSQALETAKNMGVEVRTIEPNELADAKYAANEADRCFQCKSHLYKLLDSFAREQKFNCVICGSNFDDKSDFRPGNRAAEVFGVQSPLMEAALTKEDIRNLSRQMELPTADIPASPCLASRVAYGLEITTERLKQIEKAEEFIKELGLTEFRVRHHDTIARIEVHQKDLEKVLANRSQIAEKLKQLGFKYVTVDLQGFRSGSLNEMLTEENKTKAKGGDKSKS